MTQNKEKERAKKKKKGKKLTCCQRCKRRICRWIYRRIKRCCKKKIFGVFDPKLSDYEIAGVNLADARDKLTRKKSNPIKESPTNKKTSIITLYKNKKKSVVSVPFKEKLKNEFDDISLIKPKGSKIKSLIYDLKERNLYIGLSKDSKLNLTKSEKEQFSKKAKEYEKKYRKGSYLTEYEGQYKKDSLLKNFEDKTRKDSFLDLKILENMDKSEIKKKISITSSKHAILKNMLSDYKKKKVSFTGIFNKSKIDVNKKLDKENVQKMLELYKEKQRKKKSYTFVKQSKIKQFKSDLRAKLANIY